MDSTYPELIDAARSGDRQAFIAVLRELRPRLLWLLFNEFQHLRDGHVQMLDEAERTLARWLVDSDHPERVPRDQSFWVLAKRLLWQEGKNYTRGQQRLRKALSWFRADVENAPQHTGAIEVETSLYAEQLWKAVEKLPEPHRSTLIAEGQREIEGDNRSLAQRLGVTVAAAAKRLSRARRELLSRLEGDE